MKTKNPIIQLQEEIQQSNCNVEELQCLFYKTSKDIMNNYILQIDNLEIELKELEFYFFDCEKHEDLYVHLDLLQKESSEYLYVHKKAQRRGGIDLTFGNKFFFGGILIRGIKDGDAFISGPAKVREHISKKMGLGKCDHKTLQVYFENLKKTNKITLCNQDKSQKSYDVLHSIRVGLNPEIDEKYCNALYRFVQLDYLEAKKDEHFATYSNLQEKGKLKAISYLTGVCEKYSNEKSITKKVRENDLLKHYIKKFREICKNEPKIS